MAKDDYFKVAYAILSELKEAKKNGKIIDTSLISPERFGINDSYWLDIIEGLLEKGYAKGVSIQGSKTGRITTPIKELEITPEGMEYLRDNSTMKKIGKFAHEVKDLFPRIML